MSDSAKDWQRIARELPGELVKVSWFTLQRPKVQLQAGDWKVTLDFHSEGRTRFMRMSIKCGVPCRFAMMSRAGTDNAVVSWLIKRAGGEVALDDPELRQKLILLGPDESTVRAIVSSERLRQLILADNFELLGSKRPSAGSDALVLEVTGWVEETARLQWMRDVIVETANQIRSTVPADQTS